MSETPEDVMLVADRIVSALFLPRHHDETPDAASIAERYRELKSQGLDFDTCARISRIEFVATAIRQQEKP